MKGVPSWRIPSDEVLDTGVQYHNFTTRAVTVVLLALYRDNEKVFARQAVEVQFNVVLNSQVIRITTLTFSNFELLFLRMMGKRSLSNVRLYAS